MTNYNEVLEKIHHLEWLLTQQITLAKPVLNLKEASQYMGISTSTLYKLTSTRAIPYSCPNGKMLFFKRTDLDAWMQGNPQRTKKEINQEVAEILVQKGGSINA